MLLRPLFCIAVLSFFATGCDRAQRYPSLPSTNTPGTLPAPPEEPKPFSVHPNYGWLDGAPRPDIALQFVAESTNPKEWQSLKNYWNELPGPAGVYTASLGLQPLEAASAFVAQLGVESVKIKVPRGLPDPTPLIPAANLPTLGKWSLGKQLFFDDTLLKLSPTVTRSCADCHDPKRAFTLNVATPANGKRNVPSLLNCVYNRQQFWDGRADSLEQVLIRQLDDEREPEKAVPLESSAGYLHVWPGLVKRVGGKEHYIDAFKQTFGVDPNADNIAKSLATYLRTLLSGNSVVDRVMQQGGATLEAEQFKLSAEDLKQLGTTLDSKDAAKELALGYQVFHGKGRCYVCHPGPLFTNHEFHNLGVGESANYPSPGKETGRFAFVPYGLKDRRLIGAFRTPSLRDVSLTAPYMHDGSMAKLADVLAYLNDGLQAEVNSYLDAELLIEPGRARKLLLGPQDLTALELYLRSLHGEALPSKLIEPPRK